MNKRINRNYTRQILHLLGVFIVMLAVSSCTLLANSPPPPNLSTLPPATLKADDNSMQTASNGAVTPTEWNVYPQDLVTPGEATPEVLPEGGLYTIQSGDTLWDISLKFNIPFEDLIEANSNLNPDFLLPEDTIIIPGVEQPPPTPTASPTLAEGEPWAYFNPAEGGRLLLYEKPSTDTGVIALVDNSAPLRLVGRTGDSVWLQVSLQPANITGWVIAQWINTDTALDGLPVTGVSGFTSIPTPTRPPLTTATATQTASPTARVTAAPTNSTGTPARSTATATRTPSPTATSTATGVPSITPYPTLPPVQADGHQFIANITNTSREIYIQGRARGNRPDVFSKIGDSITDNYAFLNTIGWGEYNLRGYTYLQPVIDHYSTTLARTSNSFSNKSLSAKGGWLVWHVLLPQYANPEVCNAGELPIQCEYRVVKPSVSLIMLGTNDVLTTPIETYERGIRRVIEISLEYKVIPVISTIPPFKYRDGMDGRVQEINNLLTSLAYEYDIPLWDYWSALQPLPNYGLANDGVHPGWAVPADFSPGYLEYGLTMRNLTALQALDAIYRQIVIPVESGQ